MEQTDEVTIRLATVADAAAVAAPPASKTAPPAPRLLPIPPCPPVELAMAEAEPAALDAIAEMKKVEGAIVGAGTVVNTDQFEQVMSAGGEFIVSPGLTDRLGEVIVRSGVPFLPGIANAGDIMRGYDLGLRHFKFFPAETSGGLKALKALAAPFFEAKFCPTGGVSPATAPEWLSFDPVLCVGGSWVTPKGASYEEVERLARDAAGIAR